MSNNKSSLSMEGEISGFGQTVYLDASYRQTYPPLSQENVTLTPDYTDNLLKALGGIPLVIDPSKIDVNELMAVLGAKTYINQVIVTKNPITGLYEIKFEVVDNGLTTGSYLQDIQMATNGTASVIGVTGRWEKDNRGWKYYQDGYLKGSWLIIDGTRYYLNAEGYMVTGWKDIEGDRYYFREDGHMISGGWKHIDGDEVTWYYFYTDGRMVSNEVLPLEGILYYLYPQGRLAVNEDITHKGVLYRANGKGELTILSYESTDLNNWLTGYKKPSRSGGRTAKAANLPDIFEDWYSYEKKAGLGKWVLDAYPDLTTKQGADKELLDEDDNYWIAVGPRVINKQYNDDGDLTISLTHDARHILVMGKYADVVLQHIDTGESVYLYCRIGDVKAHTWIGWGHTQNGLSQTGEPYPNNSSREQADLGSANGATVEFMGHPIYKANDEAENGTMSAYLLLKVIVYD